MCYAGPLPSACAPSLTRPVSPPSASDFCKWEELTAEDTWGRIHVGSVVTASNLFKYAGSHGLIIFQHHDPLDISRDNVM